MDIDKSSLDGLLTDPAANQQAINSILYELAGKVARTLKTVDETLWEDIRQDLWIHLMGLLEKWNPAKGAAYSYLYKCALRQSWKLAKVRQQFGQLPEPPSDMNESTLLSSARQFRDTEAVVDRTDDESRLAREVKHSLRLLDRIINKAIDEYKTIDDSSTAYQQLLGGVAFLQQYRYSLVRAYKPLKIGGVHYSKDRKTTHDGN